MHYHEYILTHERIKRERVLFMLKIISTFLRISKTIHDEAQKNARNYVFISSKTYFLCLNKEKRSYFFVFVQLNCYCFSSLNNIQNTKFRLQYFKAFCKYTGVSTRYTHIHLTNDENLVEHFPLNSDLHCVLFRHVPGLIHQWR